MKSAFQEALEHIKDIGEIEFTIRSYSGRGMYGKQCLGITIDLENIASLFFDLGQIYSKSDFYSETQSITFDNMGLSMIVYFPYVEYVDDKNEESEED